MTPTSPEREGAAVGFQSLPRSDWTKGERCGEPYYEYDGREGRVKCICSKPKGHDGYHGWAP